MMTAEADAIDVEPASGMQGDGPLDALLEQCRAAHQGTDPKLDATIEVLKPLLAEGANPVVFCRFIATAEHVAAGLRKAFPKLRIEAVTGAAYSRGATRPRRGHGAMRNIVCLSPPTAYLKASTFKPCSTPSFTTTCRGTRPGTSNAKAEWTASASRRSWFVRCCSIRPTAPSTARF